jgi:aspartyl-tRNA(Asn)/glutamyl-tRNA(Gln) amidotransferase subunit A
MSSFCIPWRLRWKRIPVGERASTLEAWESARERVKVHDAGVRAVITWIDASRADAERCDRVRSSGQPLGPLHGLLVGLKDNIDTAGVRTTAGAAFLQDNVPDNDATVVRLVREAGAVVVAKLNMAELAWGATTQNRTYGACRNPWDLSRIPGGSSGGSGAALAARYCDIALGTDTGASVRVPSAVNGVIGLRPTFGAISNRGIFPVAFTQDTVGPMALRADRAARLTDVLRQHDPEDPYSRRPEGPTPSAQLGQPIEGLRVGVPDDFFFDDVDRGVGQRIDDFLAWLRGSGAELVAIPDFGQAQTFEHWTRIVQCEGASLHRDRLETNPDDFSPDVRGRISNGLDVDATDLARSYDWRVQYRWRLNGIFEEVDAIVAPTVPIDVPAAEGYDSRKQTAALGRITYPWALHVGPTMSVPVGFHADSGMPVGVALAAPEWREATLFQLADAYQAATDWHEQLPPVLEEVASANTRSTTAGGIVR